MKKLKFLFSFAMALFMAFSIVACGAKDDENAAAEKVELATVTLENVEFKNAEGAEIKQEGNIVTVSGNIDAMTDAQKEVYNKSGITHVVALKFKFDTEKTLSKFELQGNETKVYSDTTSVKNYSGSISDLLDSKDEEDAFANLILSANTESYKLISTYTDGSVSTIELKITATLATASAE